MDYDFNKAGLYPAAWAAFKANLITMLGLAFGLVFLEYIGPIFNLVLVASIVQISIQIYAAFLVHQVIISGKTKPWFTLAEKDDTSRAFTARSIGFLIILAAVSMAVAAIVYMLGYALHTDEQSLVMVVVIVVLPIYGIILALFGTILPATVADEDKSIRTAFARGKSQFWYTLSRLIFGPILFSIATFVALFLVIFVSSITTGELVSVDVYDSSGVFDLVGATISFVAYFLNIFATGLAATTLCKAYLRYEQRPEPTPDAT